MYQRTTGNPWLLKRPDETALVFTKNGYLKTGDIGEWMKRVLFIWLIEKGHAISLWV